MRLAAERGMALVVVVMTMVFVMAIGGALVLNIGPESSIAETFRHRWQALYAAEAAAEWAMADLPSMVDDWPTLLTTPVHSSFVDGVASGARTLPDGSMIDLTAIVDASASWKPYAYGLMRDLMPPPAGGIAASPFYVVVFVAADSTAVDRLKVRAEAFGPRGAHKGVELCILREPGGIRAVSWSGIR